MRRRIPTRDGAHKRFPQGERDVLHGLGLTGRAFASRPEDPIRIKELALDWYLLVPEALFDTRNLRAGLDEPLAINDLQAPRAGNAFDLRTRNSMPLLLQALAVPIQLPRALGAPRPL